MGDTHEFKVYPKDSSGAIFPLAQYSSVEFTIAERRGTPVDGDTPTLQGHAEFSADRTHVSCAITPEDSDELDPTKSYVFDVRISKTGVPYDSVFTLLTGNISIQNMSFKYPVAEDMALKNINIEIKAGETVALVGSSGSGKTTLANMVPRFYSPTDGTITLDGQDLETIALKSLRKHIALVSQEVVLFNDSVYNNIAYGSNSDFTKEEVYSAAKLANALEFIEQLPNGFDTDIGENGTRLSGGQKQRLAIARALLKNAPILVLDEATSALDNQSEKLVQEALDRLMSNRTTLVIAHRLSTIQHADKIIVMDRGQIVEVGKHDELLANKGHYANLYNIQFRSSALTS
jgi:subfamily B ATP-binding cassette protein MsbA